VKAADPEAAVGDDATPAPRAERAGPGDATPAPRQGGRQLPLPRRQAMSGGTVLVEVEQAMGPGVDLVAGPHGELIGRRARASGLWLGFDRAALADSDDGMGRRVAVLVATPVSTFPGCRLEVELTGGWRTGRGPVLLGVVPRGPMPPTALARVAGSIPDDAVPLDAGDAADEARRARRRWRERRGRERIVEGRAWMPPAGLRPEVARAFTPHSAAEYSLSKVPPRFLRGLERLLDGDERVLHWVERPFTAPPTMGRLLRRGDDPRAAMLVLTDRQLVWMVDHARPDRHLTDWGVDAEVIPVERLLGVVLGRAERPRIRITVRTSAGERSFPLPVEADAEADVLARLLSRFVPAGAGTALRRRYREPTGPFDPSTASAFGQEHEAAAVFAQACRDGEVLAMLYSPRRPGQPEARALILRTDGAELRTGDRCVRMHARDIASIGVTLSPLVGRVVLSPAIGLAFPGPMVAHGARLVRSLRRIVADAPS
jgi:hypothetical protein